MIRSLATAIALGHLLACGGTSAVPAGDAGGSTGGDAASPGHEAGSSDSEAAASDGEAGWSGGGDADHDGGGTTADGGPACAFQSCNGGCCDGTYCWGFSNICLQNDTCPGAGINMPVPGLCSCDGFPAGSCPAGQTCPAPVHGHATFCAPVDGGPNDGG